MPALEALIFGAAGVLVALILRSMLLACLAELAAWREGKWKAHDVAKLEKLVGDVCVEVEGLKRDDTDIRKRLQHVEPIVERLNSKNELSKGRS